MEHTPHKEVAEEGAPSPKLSAKQLQKLLRAQEREEKERKHREQEEQKLNEFNATYSYLFGIAPLVGSKPNEFEQSIFSNIKGLSEEHIGQTVLIQARLQSTQLRSKIRSSRHLNPISFLGNKFCFVMLRQNMYSIQAVIEAVEEPVKVPRDMVKLVAKVPLESIVEVTGVLRSAQVRGASQHSIELNIQKFFIISRAEPLPILYEDISRPFSVFEEQRNKIETIDMKIRRITETIPLAANEASRAQIEGEISKLDGQRTAANVHREVGLSMRLDNRVIDLRTAANHAIFKIQSSVCTLFRQALRELKFIEIHTPKFVASTSRGHANLFQVKYYKQQAYLAQSPQFAKQMAVIGDMERVFEIGPAFRAEHGRTARHLTEFTSLDLEMQIYQHYHEILDLLEHVFGVIFNSLRMEYHHELTVISQQHPFEPLQYKPVRITFAEAVQMINESPANEYPMHEEDSFMTVHERLLCVLMKEKYGTDFFIVDQFPLFIRPFYDMPNPEDSRYSNALDVFMRGQKIGTGSQRVHSYQLLLERALEHQIEPESIAPYLESFKFGAPPHGGFGIGLERIMMSFLNLGNIRRASLFPRDSDRLTP